jgi:hypothetical protein
MQTHQYAAGRHTDAETLSLAHSLGTRFDLWTLKGAAAVDAVSKLQWLCTFLQCAPSTDFSYQRSSIDSADLAPQVALSMALSLNTIQRLHF